MEWDSLLPANEKNKLYISSDGSHTHTFTQEGGKIKVLSPDKWDENEDERKWRWGENENDIKVA